MNILFSIENRPHEHAGGRYHGLMHACCLAEAGHSVTFCTNVLPRFYDDVIQWFDLNEDNWEVWLCSDYGFKVYERGPRAGEKRSTLG